MKRLKEIETRLSAIRAELDAEGADIKALNDETDKLIEERRGILENIEKRKKILDKIDSGAAGDGAPVIKEPEERKFGADSAEYRSAFLKRVRDIELSDVEKRAFTSATASAGVVIPTQTANEIIKKMK